MSSFVRRPNRIGWPPSLFKTDLLYSNPPASVITRKGTGEAKFQGSFTFTAVSNATGIWNANSNLSSSFATVFSADVVQIEDAVATLGFGFTTIASATAVFKASATLESSSTLSATCATGGEQVGVAELTSSFSFTADATEGSIEQGEALLSSTFTAVADAGVASTQSGASSLSSSFTTTADASIPSPIELSSIVTWWDAKSGRTVDSSTPPRLTSWADRAGPSQQTLTRFNIGPTDRAPEYSATGGALNGPVIDFNGTSHSMYAVDDPILSATKASIFLLAKLDSNKQQTLFSNQAGKTDNTDPKGFTISQNSTGELKLITNHASSNLHRETQNAVDLTSWTLIEVYYDTGWEVKINGTTPALETNNTSQANLPPVHTSGDMTLFAAGSHASSAFVGGLISDAVFYNEKLSTSNQLIVRNYLRKKQGLNIESATATLEASFSTTADASVGSTQSGASSLSSSFTSSATATSLAGIEFDSLEVWWDSGQGVNLSSGAVQWWDARADNVTGTPNPSAQGTSGRPAYSATGGALGGPILDFDGTDDYLLKGYGSTTPFLSGTKSSVFIVIKTGDSSTTGYIMSNQWGANGGTQGQGVSFHLVSGKLRVTQDPNDTNSGTTTSTTDNAIDLTDWTILECYYGPTGTGTNSGWLFKADGVSLNTRPQNDANLPANPQEYFTIGGANHADGGHGFLDAQIADIIIYDEELSTANALTVRQYLKNHHGLNIVSATATLEASFSTTADATEGSIEQGEASLSCTFSASATSTLVLAWSNDYSLSLDGTNDYVDVSSFAQDTIIGSGDFTISTWAKATSTHSGVIHSWIAGDTSDDGTVRFQFHSGGKLRLVFKDSGWASAYSTNSYSTDTWYNIVVTRSGNQAYLYVNTSQWISINNSNVAHDMSGASLEFNIGRYRQNYSGAWLNGKVDEVAVWDKVLTSTERATVYNSGVPSDLTSDVSSRLVGYWRFEDNTVSGSGGSVADSSTKSNTATLTNGPTFSTDRPS